MDRKKLLFKSFQRGHILILKNAMYKDWFERFIVEETKSDLGRKGDITSLAVITKGQASDGIVFARQDGIIGGIEEAVYLYGKNNIRAIPLKRDGDAIKKGEVFLKLSGYQKDLLLVERSALDILQRMSGIATLTSKVIKQVKNKIPISPTRKTHWRFMDKKAVYIGGGLTHRLALWESILIKDNHLLALRKEGAADPIKTSLERAASYSEKANFIEIEINSLNNALHAAEIFKKLKINKPCFIMLDNMPPKEIIKTISALKRKDFYDGILLEASGGITPKNVSVYAKTGVDVISMGYLTNFSPLLDIKQDIV